MKKQVSWLCVICLTLLALSGCSKEEAQDGNQENKKITLSTVSMFGGTDPNSAVYKEINQAFMQQHQNITIKDDSASSNEEWKNKVVADFSVNKEPDVLFFFTDANAEDLLQTNKFVSLEEIKAQYPDYGKNIKEDILKTMKAPDGKNYALPVTGYFEGLFCNKDLFEKYNLPLPTTWDNFINAIKVFKENNIIPISVSLNEVPHYWVDHLILSQGGLEEHGLSPKDTAPESWIKGLEYLKTLKDMGAFPTDTDSIKDADAVNLFKEKKSAMHLDGSWIASGIPDQENTTVLSFPTVPEGKKAETDLIEGFSSGFYITKKAWEDPNKREAAVQFVMAHTSNTSIEKYWSGSGVPVADVAAPSNLTPLLQDGITLVKNAKAFNSAVDARLKPEAFKTMVAAASDIASGRKSAQEIVEKVVSLNSK